MLRWRAGEIQKIAEANKLAANDASRAAQYVAELAETRPSGAMLRAVGGAILPEIALALQEDRLAPGDAQICAAFRLAHETLLEQFFPEEATAQAETDAIAVEPPIAPDAFVGPARELGCVVRDHEAMSGALKDFVVQIELIAEDHMRLAMAGPDAERDLAFVRFAKRAGAFIRQFVLRVQEVILLEGLAPGDKASVYGLSIALMDKLMPIWSKLVELLPQLF